MLLERLPAPVVHHPRGGADLRVGEVGDVLEEEVHEATLPLEEGQQLERRGGRRPFDARLLRFGLRLRLRLGVGGERGRLAAGEGPDTTGELGVAERAEEGAKSDGDAGEEGGAFELGHG